MAPEGFGFMAGGGVGLGQSWGLEKLGRIGIGVVELERAGGWEESGRV